MRPFCTAISPPQAIVRLELDNLAEIENSVENEMGCDDYHKHMTIAELRDNFAGDEIMVLFTRTNKSCKTVRLCA